MKAIFAAGVWTISALLASEVIAGSVAIQQTGLKQAVRLSPRIVVVEVVGTEAFRFPGSAEYAAQPAGSALHVLRAKAVRTLKGAPLSGDVELKVFNPAQWFQHTHAAAIKGGVISYVDSRYSGGIAEDRVKPGMKAIFFLSDESVPKEFPPGSAFLRFASAYDSIDREKDVVAEIAEGVQADFDRLVILKRGVKIRFPDKLEIKFLEHSHKRPIVGGPQKEWIRLELSQNANREIIELAHHTTAQSEGARDTWETRSWKGFTFEARPVMTTEEATVVVQKVGKGANH